MRVITLTQNAINGRGMQRIKINAACSINFINSFPWRQWPGWKNLAPSLLFSFQHKITFIRCTPRTLEYIACSTNKVCLIWTTFRGMNFKGMNFRTEKQKNFVHRSPHSPPMHTKSVLIVIPWNYKSRYGIYIAE